MTGDCSPFVMAGSIPAIHVFFLRSSGTWMPGTSPGMTTEVVQDSLDSIYPSG